MEILNLLEERVIRLMHELERTREENRRILEESSGQVASLQNELQSLRDENQTLKGLLTQEKQVKDDVLQRVDTLLDLLKELD